MAIEYKLPLFLHERCASVAFCRVLRRCYENGEKGFFSLSNPPIYPSFLSPSPLLFSFLLARGVVHCFTGTKEEAVVYLEMGFYIGVTGWVCDERRNGDLLKALSVVPLDRLMIEVSFGEGRGREGEQPKKTKQNKNKHPSHLFSPTDRCTLLNSQNHSSSSQIQ